MERYSKSIPDVGSIADPTNPDEYEGTDIDLFDRRQIEYMSDLIAKSGTSIDDMQGTRKGHHDEPIFEARGFNSAHDKIVGEPRHVKVKPGESWEHRLYSPISHCELPEQRGDKV